MKEIFIKEQFIRLDSALKFCGEAQTGGQAKIIIQEGQVSVNGEICTMRGKKLYKDDKIKYNGCEYIIQNEG